MVLLLASCIGSYLASEAAKKDDRRGMIFGLGLNLVLALGGLAFRAWDWRLWDFKWNTTAYGSITWGIVFLHTIEPGVDIAFTIVLVIILIRGKYGPRQRLGVHVDSIIWYFLVAIWIPLYVVVYWGPYFLGGSS